VISWIFYTVTTDVVKWVCKALVHGGCHFGISNKWTSSLFSVARCSLGYMWLHHSKGKYGFHPMIEYIYIYVKLLIYININFGWLLRRAKQKPKKLIILLNKWTPAVQRLTSNHWSNNHDQRTQEVGSMDSLPGAVLCQLGEAWYTKIYFIRSNYRAH